MVDENFKNYHANKTELNSKVLNFFTMVEQNFKNYHAEMQKLV